MASFLTTGKSDKDTTVKLTGGNGQGIESADLATINGGGISASSSQSAGSNNTSKARDCPPVVEQVFSSTTLSNIREKILEVQKQMEKEKQHTNIDDQKRPFDDTPPNKGYLLEPEPYEADSEEDEESLKQANYYDDWYSFEAFKCVNVLKENVAIIRNEMNSLEDWRPGAIPLRSASISAMVLERTNPCSSTSWTTFSYCWRSFEF